MAAHELLGHTFNRIDLKFRVFFANIGCFREGRRSECCLCLVKILETHQNNTLGRFPLDRQGPGADCEVFAATIQDRSLSRRNVFLHKTVFVRYIDFRNDPGGRLGLSMQASDGQRTKSKTR